MIPQAAIDLILDAEGIDQPSEWPGEDSGISLGRGYDLSAESRDELAHDWQTWLGADAIARLGQAVGKSGEAAHAIAHQFRDIHITPQAADAVFLAATLPKYEQQTRNAFHGYDQLPDPIRGALVSLVFNRGPGMNGDRRTEMRAIRDVIFPWSNLDVESRKLALAPLVHSIAAQFRAMKRLWIGHGEDGLLTRRENEAKLVESTLG